MQINNANTKGRRHRGKNSSAIFSWELIFIKRGYQLPIKQLNEKKSKLGNFLCDVLEYLESLIVLNEL